MWYVNAIVFSQENVFIYKSIYMFVFLMYL